jgi:enoyl-CoA hydratase/carnithine racemase
LAEITESYKYLQVSLDKSIYKVTLNRPDKLNAFDQQMFTEFSSILGQIKKDRTAKVVIFTGNGRAFCAGGDINGFFLKMIEDREAGRKPFNVPEWMTSAGLLLHELPIPTIAAIHGAAIGFGFTLCLQCDIRIVAEDTIIGLPFVKLGIIPEYGCTYVLPRLVGFSRACELIYTGKTIKAHEAQNMGLVSSVVPNNELLSTAQALAENISEGAIIALKLAKEALYKGVETGVREQLKFEEKALADTLATEDHATAIRAFIAKSKPVFKGK